MDYSKAPLIVKPSREIPQEIMFNLTHAERDPNIPNRLWFTLPENWSYTLDKDCIIGIRDMFVARTQRNVVLRWTASIYSKENTTSILLSHVFEVDCWMDSKDTLIKLIETFNTSCQEQVEAFKTCYELSEHPEVDNFRPFRLLMEYKDGYLRMTLSTPMNTDVDCPYGVKISSTSYNADDLKSLLITPPSEVLKDIDPNGSQQGPLYSNKDGTVRYMFFGWDRYNLYLTSNISSLTTDNYLGHTDRVYTPIKYYRLHSGDHKIWVDTWSTRNHTVRSILPLDNLDEFIIEALVCFDSSAMI